MTHRNDWDEFQWERELRQYESRIARFYHGLVYCLDLPAEEADFPIGTATPSDPVPASCNPALLEWLKEHDQDDEENPPPERHPSCFAPVDAIDRMCVEWNVIFASELPLKFLSFGMGINCAFAKLLARCADFTEPEKDCAPALLITLGKRSLLDLAELTFMLDEIGKVLPALQQHTSRMKVNLLIVREQFLARLNEIRNAAN